jgi:hypothetical protein
MVAIVEIDEQGNVNPAQYQQAIARVQASVRAASSEGRKTTLVTFVHGRHHGCRTCDDNLTCFRRVLAELSAEEPAAASPRNIIGVYVGWRGRLFLGKADVVSIWNRKRVAEYIGKKGGKELLTQLHNIWVDAHGDVTMVTVGHSLGGALLLSAVRYGLTGNVDDILRDGSGNYRIVRASGMRAKIADGTKALRARFGDLIVLMNPAIEAVQYEVFDSDLADDSIKSNSELLSRRLPPDKLDAYATNQLPIMVTIAGEEDSAVGRIFPVARGMQLKLLPSYRTGLGHWDPEVTHTLHYTGVLPKEETGRCSCATNSGKESSNDIPVLVEYGTEAQQTNEPKDTQSAVIPGKPQLLLQLTPTRKCSNMPCRGWDSHSPYVVIRADKSVIRDHDDIFNPAIVAFLKDYLRGYEQAKASAGIE